VVVGVLASESIVPPPRGSAMNVELTNRPVDAGRPSLQQLLFGPNISLNGRISEESTLPFFLERLAAVRASGEDIILELNTAGGDADAACRIALEIRLFIRHSGRQAYCVGKTVVYSAGVTIFAAFPNSCRFLTEDAVLLVHERRLEKSLELNGPIKSCIQIVSEQLHMLETAERQELEGFRELTEGSTLGTDELYELATRNCYIPAAQALELGLIAEVLT
jgi:ATP-dependent protease ClpP protease subunit